MKTVLLDCDEVLCDFSAEAIAWANHPSCTFDSIHTWDVLEAWGLQHRQEELDAHFAVAGTCEGLDVMPGAVEFVDRLRQSFDVHVVTSPYGAVPTWTYERTNWLKKHFGFRSRDIFFCKQKHRVHGDALVDDRLENLVPLKHLRILLEKPWNRVPHTVGIVRCMDLGAVAAALETFL